MEVVLIRHGEASWDAKTDMERELSERGQQQVSAAADWLRAAGWQADQVWASPYRRAQQTASLLDQGAARVIASLGPDSSLPELEAMLATFTEQRLVLVAHNPLLSNAVGRWHDGRPQSYWGLQPASMALLEAELMAPGCAQLQWLRHYPNYDHNGQ